MRQITIDGAEKTRRGAGPGSGHDLTPMALSLGVGLCTLPFVFLLVAPWFGLQVALGTALAVLAGITIVCWTLCASGRAPHTPTGFRW